MHVNYLRAETKQCSPKEDNKIRTQASIHLKTATQVKK